MNIILTNTILSIFLSLLIVSDVQAASNEPDKLEMQVSTADLRTQNLSLKTAVNLKKNLRLLPYICNFTLSGSHAIYQPSQLIVSPEVLS